MIWTHLLYYLLLLALLLGPPMIRLLVRRQIGAFIRQEGPKSHQAKAGTPTMGGLLILLAVVVATLLWMELSNRFVWIALGTLVTQGIVGFADDFVKFARRRNLDSGDSSQQDNIAVLQVG